MKDKFKVGDKVAVQKHYVTVGNVKVLVESFVGIVINEIVNKAGETYISINSSGKKSGERVVAEQYVLHLDADDSDLEYDGKNYRVRCCECGSYRTIKPQHVSQVTRCRSCQAKRNTKKARSRAVNRYEELKNATIHTAATTTRTSPKAEKRGKD